CRQKTEMSLDEVYFILAGKVSTGEAIATRLPHTGHWNIDDNGDNRTVDNLKLMKGSLQDGQMLNLVVFIMEEDHNKPEHGLELANAVARDTSVNPNAIGTDVDVERALEQYIFSHEPTRIFGGAVIPDMGTAAAGGFFQIGDADDCLGIVGLRVTAA